MRSRTEVGLWASHLPRTSCENSAHVPPSSASTVWLRSAHGRNEGQEAPPYPGSRTGSWLFRRDQRPWRVTCCPPTTSPPGLSSATWLSGSLSQLLIFIFLTFISSNSWLLQPCGVLPVAAAQRDVAFGCFHLLSIRTDGPGGLRGGRCRARLLGSEFCARLQSCPPPLFGPPWPCLPSCLPPSLCVCVFPFLSLACMRSTFHLLLVCGILARVPPRWVPRLQGRRAGGALRSGRRG